MLPKPTYWSVGFNTVETSEMPLKQHAITRAPEERLNWKTSLPFFLVHLLCLLAFVTGVSKTALVLFLTLYWVRMFFITAGYHRYFSHRSYKLGRVMQFVMAFGGASAVQKGPLWWASHHRDHHRYSDTDLDLHSPLKGFWWSHVGWILCDKNNAWNPDDIKDFAKYPELRWINKHDAVAPWMLGIFSWYIGGWSGLVFGFLCSTVLLWHSTFAVNSLAHVMGRRRYATTDTSRNSVLVALLTLGEGWHNNHHYFQASSRQGFFWWELDISYYVLKMLSWVGLVQDLKQPPERMLAAGRVRDGSFDMGMFKSHWAKATAALNAVRPAALGVTDDGTLDPEIVSRRDRLEDLITANAASLHEHAQSTLAHAEELARLSRRERSMGMVD
jgi:stearoyl-CoA desaturase (delta-9 desaturase)